MPKRAQFSGYSASYSVGSHATSSDITMDSPEVLLEEPIADGDSKASDIAKCLIHLAAAEEEPEFLTHLRLQKLLYLAQGWSLAMRNKALFNERIEAWAHGPVVPAVYKEFKLYGEKPIDPTLVLAASKINVDERKFLSAMWGSYKKYSSSSLRQMTHEHEPWVNARKGLKPSEVCHTEITRGAMKAYFTKLLKA